MADLKTKATGASVAEYIASRASEEQAADCKRLMAMMRKLTKKTPKMWGPSIVGYGSYRYTTAGGRSGEMPVAAFAIRGRDLVVYLSPDDPQQEPLRAKLGKHSMGKSCLYFKRLADIDVEVLEQLISSSLPAAQKG